MGNKKWTRLLALCLAVVCTFTVVAAADSFEDVNGDGKYTVWDLQALFAAGSEINYEATLEKVLGGKDELKPKTVDGETVYYISSELGLRNLIKNADKGYTFELANDIDLGGADWTPITFSGNFNGNGHSIKNVTITKDVNLSTNNQHRMGFFAKIGRYENKDGETVQSKVKDLNLENVDLTAQANSTYIGLLAGTNEGIVENCTATGKVTDNRTELASDVYVGALVGQNANHDTLPGKLYKGSGSLLTVGNGTDDDKVSGVSAVLGTVYAELAEDETDTRCTGIAGYSASANLDSGMLWQDASNSTAYTSEAEQKNRATVEQEMYKMGSVKWTPSTTFTFTRYDTDSNALPGHTHSNAFVADKGYTYIGIPYVGAKDGSYARFLSQMQATKVDDCYVTVKDLADGKQYTADYTYDGFVQYMGSNCTWAVVWSWATVSPHRVHNTTDSATNAEKFEKDYGGVSADTVPEMIPTESREASYGVIPVGNYTVADGTTDTQTIVVGNEKAMAECYAQAHKGDAIVVSGLTLSGSQDSHTRMLADDPVIIRQGKSGTLENTIDLERSYILYHGQGDGLSDASTKQHIDDVGTYTIKFSSWRLYKKVTLTALLTETGCQAAKNNGEEPGSYWGYIPVTMEAFSWSDTYKANNNKLPYYNTSGNAAITLPNTGTYYSNYRNVSATMVIKEKDSDNVPYEHTSYMETTVAAASFQTPDLSVLFEDATKDLTPGTTYLYTLYFTASDGTVTYPQLKGKGGGTTDNPILKDYEFTYTAS